MSKSTTNKYSDKYRHSKNKDEISKDSSDVSSNEDDNMTNDHISRHAKETYIQNELYEKIIKYLKLDDMIKEKQKEISKHIKLLKEKKQEMESFIIGYLDQEEEDFVKIDGEGKLTKTVSITKGAIKPDIIKQTLVRGIKENNLISDDTRLQEFLLTILQDIDNNRPRKTKTYIKRTKEKKQPEKKTNKIAELKNKIQNDIFNNNNNIDVSDDELPTY
jgi:hypothetical protein